MSVKYGRPIKGNNGEIIGYTADHDGDGVYDDFDPIVSDPISKGDGFTTHTADHDGDGVYDDYTIYLDDDDDDDNTTDNTTDNTDNDNSPRQTTSSSTGGGLFSLLSKKTWIILGIIAGFFMLSSISYGILSIILTIIYGIFRA